MNRRLRPLALAANVIAATAIATTLLAACGDDTATLDGGTVALAGYELDPAPQVGDLSLPDASADGVDFTFRAEPGHLLLVYFGYTMCPDICPTTLSEVKKARQALGERSDSIYLAMVTVDPTRDLGDLLTSYVQSFIPSAHALRTEDDSALQTVAGTFGAGYSVTTNDDGAVEVSHSGNVFVVDATGAVVLVWPFGITGASMAGDLATLLDRGVA